MIHFDGTQLVMAAMPKTGTRWVCAAMSEIGHPPAYDIAHGHDLDGLWIHRSLGRITFTALRHPATWLASIWAHSHRQPVFQPPAGPSTILVPYVKQSWPVFLRCMIRHPELVDSIYRAYEYSADIVIRTEGLNRWTHRLLANHGFSHEQAAKACGIARVNEADDKPEMTRVQVEAIEESCRYAFHAWMSGRKALSE